MSPAAQQPPTSPAPVTPSPVIVRLKLFDGSWTPCTSSKPPRKEKYTRCLTNLQRNRKGRRHDFNSGRDIEHSPIRKRYIVRPSHRRPWVKPLTPAEQTPSPSATPTSRVEQETLSPRELSHVLRGEVLTNDARRLMIAGYFVEAMGSPPEEDDTEAITWIVKEFNMPSGSRDVVRRIIDGVRQVEREMVPYTGVRQSSSRERLMAVPLDSVGASIIAKSMEDGAGIRRAHADAMDWLRRRHEAGEADVPYWGLSATYACYLRMQPTVTVVQKRGQGNSDPASAWCQACLGWATQPLIRSRRG